MRLPDLIGNQACSVLSASWRPISCELQKPAKPSTIIIQHNNSCTLSILNIGASLYIQAERPEKPGSRLILTMIRHDSDRSMRREG